MNVRLIVGVMVQSRSVTDNFWKSIKSYPSLCVSISTYFLYFRQFPKLSFNKSRDLSRILCLFITTAIFTGSECFWWVLNVGNTVILTGLTYTSSRNVFQDILANSGVKKSIMGRSSVRKMDE